MELLEYSLQDRLPYDLTLRKYYAGPSIYLHKNENQLYYAQTGDLFKLKETEIKNVSQSIRNNIINKSIAEYVIEPFNNKENFLDFDDINHNEILKYSSKPDLNTKDLIAASTDLGHLIPHYRYFTAIPTIGDNSTGGVYGNGNSGTCGAVAAQLLLGYNNYYNDRRIIEDRFLNGYDDTTNTVTLPERNPNYCSDPMLMTNWTTGTRSENTGTNSFYAEIISKIMKPNTEGATSKEVKNGLKTYLNEHISSNDFTVNYSEKNWWFGYSPIDSSLIKSELNAGRPLIISMDSNLGGSNHFVVGYGYQDYTYPDGSGTYEGYVVHFGWPGDTRTCVWINSSWCDGYISLKLNHTHNYITVGTISNTNRTEYKCSECGHRTDAAINFSKNNRYIERIAVLSKGESQDYYVTFKSSGNKLIQTFGTNDTRIYLYDSEYKLLAQNDDSGYSLNAFLNFTSEVGIPYILRVEFYNTSTQGTVKIGITPASIVYTAYEDIWNSNSNSLGYYFSSIINTTNIITFTPTESGLYTMQTDYTGENRIDTCLYLIDPSSTESHLFNDDGAGNLQAQIKTNLIANKPYFFIISAYDITTVSDWISLHIVKS